MTGCAKRKPKEIPKTKIAFLTFQEAIEKLKLINCFLKKERIILFIINVSYDEKNAFDEHTFWRKIINRISI